MGGVGSGRKPDPLKALKPQPQKPVATVLGGDMFLPNHSGVGSHPEARVSFVDHDFLDGTIKETFNALVSSNGSTVTLTLTNAEGGSDLTLQFSDGDFKLSSGSTITLTAGSDASPTENYVYVTDASKILEVSTSDFPNEEHIKIAYLLVPSASFVQTKGVYINQNWNDHIKGTDGQGHLSHITERLRHSNAIYHAGIDGNGTDGYLTPTASNVDFKSTAGLVYQIHRKTIEAHDTSTGDVLLVKNWSGDAYHDLTNLFDITADSTGTTIGNNKYFNLVFWGVANKSGTYSPFIINLPSGSYNTQADAESDVSGYDDFSIPSPFNRESSTGFLIARVTIQMGTTWSVISTSDLRGNTPFSASGGVSGFTSEFADNAFRVHDEADPTKELAFDCGANITTGTVRTVTIPDDNGTLPLLERNNTWSGTNDFSNDVNITSNNSIFFRDSDISISSRADGDLRIISDGDIDIICSNTAGSVNLAQPASFGFSVNDTNNSFNFSDALNVTLNFIPTVLGTTGVLQWQGLADDFNFQDNIIMSTSKEVKFTTNSQAIGSPFTGNLYIDSGTDIDFQIGGTTQLNLIDGVFRPETDNDIDLGSTTQEFKDGYFDGTVYMDAIGFGTTSLTLPSGDGSADQVLTTNGSGTISWADQAGGSATKEFFISCTQFVNEGETTLEATEFTSNNMSATGSFKVQFMIPHDFTSITEAVVVICPDATETVNYSVDSTFCAAGELINNHTDTVTSSLSVTDNTVAELDFTGAMTGIAANDYFAMQFNSDTSNIRAIGIRIKYS